MGHDQGPSVTGTRRPVRTLCHLSVLSMTMAKASWTLAIAKPFHWVTLQPRWFFRLLTGGLGRVENRRGGRRIGE